MSSSMATVRQERGTAARPPKEVVETPYNVRARQLNVLAAGCIAGTLIAQYPFFYARSGANSAHENDSERFGTAAFGFKRAAQQIEQAALAAEVAGSGEIAEADQARDSLAREAWSAQWLEAGWDGDDGVAPSADAVEEAVKIINLLPANAEIPKLAIAGDGEILLRWQRADRLVEISLLGDGVAYGFSRARPPVADDDTMVKTATPISFEALPRELHNIIPSVQV